MHNASPFHLNVISRETCRDGQQYQTSQNVIMQIKIVYSKILQSELKDLCSSWFEDMVKIVVIIKRDIIAVGGTLHADTEELLMEHGSRQHDS